MLRAMTSYRGKIVLFHLRKIKMLLPISIFQDISTRVEIDTTKSSHRRCSIKKAVLKNFAIFTGKQNTSAGVSYL